MKKRQEFILAERDRESRVDLKRLSHKEATIHQLHQEAVKDLKFTYDDPFLGLKVLTTYRHTLKGTCCGQARWSTFEYGGGFFLHCDLITRQLIS